ncbi:uncharacterized protein FSUBG_8355 [Fusarium subglutinans]|uniref:Uncharacterized protein n=1 Tax=Gibberella subglutinans TaxID=42677 RepID=A0A8H5PIZ4_GIBSU|nr:uncharacterized protein FSUBG_8355 [Fusarium subglutinans]KAF5597705.1 hypothetical protein FSUBG_8355 [Fusarium subglutinans]
MDDKKTPEERPEDIGSVVEQLPDFSAFPSLYLTQLRVTMRPEHGQPMTLLQYLEKDPVKKLTTQHQTPKKWLENLTTVDFRDPNSIINLQFDLAEYNVGNIILCTNGKDAFAVSPYPGAMTVDDTPALKDSDVHPGLLSLEFVDDPENLSVSEPGESAKSSEIGQPLPSLVMPIGHFLKGYITESGIMDLDDTNYVLVVDAVASAHPVWLIFDRNAKDMFEEEEEDDKEDKKGGDGKDNNKDIHPDTVELVFDGTERNFDAAQVLPSIQDWFESYENLSVTQIRDSFRKTGLTGKIKAREVTAGDASVLWNKDTTADKNK